VIKVRAVHDHVEFVGERKLEEVSGDDPHGRLSSA
jgi:hypothetical protein